jgi:hypothetical protein
LGGASVKVAGEAMEDEGAGDPTEEAIGGGNGEEGHAGFGEEGEAAVVGSVI